MGIFRAPRIGRIISVFGTMEMKQGLGCWSVARWSAFQAELAVTWSRQLNWGSARKIER